MARTREIEDQQILDISRKLLLEHGLSLSTKLVASTAGISEGVIFQRFGTKEGLLQACLAPDEVDAQDIVAGAAKHPDPRRALQDVSVAVFTVLRATASRALPALGRRPDARRVLTAPASPVATLTAALEKYLAESNARGDLRVLAPASAARLLIGALHHAALLEAVAGPLPHVNERAVRELVDVLWSGLDRRV